VDGPRALGDDDRLLDRGLLAGHGHLVVEDLACAARLNAKGLAASGRDQPASSIGFPAASVPCCGCS
jgi:hypothetical protein